MGLRIYEHPILGSETRPDTVSIEVDGVKLSAKAGEMIAAVLMANGLKIHRYTHRLHEPRGIYCGIGQCTDCVMIVNGVQNVRTCVTAVEDGMVIKTQH